MQVIGSPVDFVGINIYGPAAYVRAANSYVGGSAADSYLRGSAAGGFASLPFPAKFPMMNSSWLRIAPEALYWGPRNLAKVWNVKDIYITENGASAVDQPAADGIVYDLDRVMYLRNYLTQLQRATAEGVPVRGYFLWSLLDNFEWADGYATRFGLVHVDYETQTRTPKSSAYWYGDLIRGRLAP